MSDKVSVKELSHYINTRCRLLTQPRCTECSCEGVVYHDEMDGNDYCLSCLEDSINADVGIMKEIRLELK